MRAASARRGAALACAVVAAAGGAMAADLPPLTQRDDGRTIELRVGDRLALELPQIAGTGFGWAPDGPVPVAIELRQEPFRPRSNMPGSDGTAVWTVLAVAPGEGALRLKLWRPWEGDVSIRQRFGVTLQIRP